MPQDGSGGDRQDNPEAEAKASKEFGLVELADFEAVEIEAPIAECRSVHCWKLADLYQSAANAANAAGERSQGRVYGLLADVARMHFKPEDRTEPYGPMAVFEGKRTIIPEDLRGEQSVILAKIAPNLKNPGLRALLGDIAWLNDKSLGESARLATASFIEAVRSVAAGDAQLYSEDDGAASHQAVELLRRACELSRATGRKEPEASDLVALIVTLSENAAAADDASGYHWIGELMLDYRVGNPVDVAKNAEAMAALEGLLPQLSRPLWELAAKAHRQSSNEEGNNRCLIMAAECFVSEAKIHGLSGMAAASFLMDAISALRGLPGTRDRRAHLEELLRNAQVSILDEMGTVSTEVDLSDVVDRVRKRVGGETLIEALRYFALITESPDPVELKREALEQAQRNPLSSMMPMSVHDDEGKVVSKSSGIAADGEDESKGLRYLIARNEAIRRHLTVSGLIEPARSLIQTEHRLSARHLHPIASMSPFVPAGHIEIFVTGFARFFGGDIVTALHLLVPQLENSLRHVLKQVGVDTSSIKSDLTQTNRTLSTMLDKDRTTLEEVFNPEIVFEIENLFDHESGPSLRHQLAHGLLSTDGASSSDAMYACWFIFRLCMIPLFQNWKPVSDFYSQW